MKKFLILVLFGLLAIGTVVEAKSLTEMLPGDTMFFCQLNLGKLLQQKNVQEWISATDKNGGNQAMDTFFGLTGFDPRRDLTAACLFLLPNNQGKGKRPSVGFLWQGKLNVQKLAEAWNKASDKPKDLSFGSWNGLTTLEDTKKKEPLITFLTQDTGFVGEKIVLERLLAFSKEKTPALAKHEAAKTFLKKSDTKAGVWGFGVVPEEYGKFVEKEPTKAPPLAFVKGVVFSGDFKENLEICGHVLCRSKEAKDLDRVFGLLENMMTALRAVGQQAPGMATVLENVKMEKAKEAVKLTLSLSKKQLEALPTDLGAARTK